MNGVIYAITASIMSETESGINIDISQRIRAFNVTSDYSSYIFPVSYIDVYLSIEEFRTVSMHDIEIVMSLKKLKINDKAKQLIESSDYIFKDKIFEVVNEDNLIIQQSSANRNTEQASLLHCRFVMMPKEDISANKINMFGNYVDCDLGNVVSYAVGKLNQEKKTVIQDPHNTKIYDQILVPFNTVLRNLVYLDTVYGIYKHGLKLFMDFNINYILDRNKNEIDGYTNLISINVTDSNETINPEILPNTIKLPTSNMSFVKNNKAKKEYIGTDVNSIIPTDDIMKISKTNYSDNKTKVYYQTYSNPYTSNSLNPNNDTLVKVVCSNADISYMNFVNSYVINIATKEFDGIEFNLTNYSNKFIKTAQGYYELQSLMTLRKIV